MANDRAAINGIVPDGKYSHVRYGPLLITACGGEGSAVITERERLLGLSKELHLTVNQIKYGLRRLLIAELLVT